MKKLSLKPAFSMIEVVFVILVLGIVSSIGAEIVANVYESYIVQRGQHRASIKTQLALNQITNRLKHTIPQSMGRRIGRTGTFELSTETMANDSNLYTVLQWVGTDSDSFEASSSASRNPGWSGFADIASSTSTLIQSPASDFDLTNTIQTSLGRTGNFALYFPRDFVAHTATGAGSTITLDTPSTRIVERYKIAWSSYALVVENGDLRLYYNFAPSIAASIGSSSSLLLKNVTNFKFETRGQTTRIKICVKEQISEGFSIPSCKEKAVF
ncbi:MAG: prepilin-type N-terminal cleavage/methylation domain-containing protein [Sulfurovum sp.]|nr:prepilin-type N-terminal cleavage/methylation domain-containing protein [Sulfurovum sp.]